MARLSASGWSFTTVLPLGEVIFSTSCGFIRTPLFATVAATIAIWSGVTPRRSCPNASRPGSTWKSFFGKKSLLFL